MNVTMKSMTTTEAAGEFLWGLLRTTDPSFNEAIAEAYTDDEGTPDYEQLAGDYQELGFFEVSAEGVTFTASVWDEQQWAVICEAAECM